MKKQLLLFILLMSMVCTNAFAYDIAVENADGVTIYYNYYNDATELEVTYVVSGTNNSSAYQDNVVIPEEVTIENKTLKVTAIGRSAFYSCSSLISVTIPHSVTSIGSSAFSNCSAFTSVTIPNSVTTIGNNAFYGCSGLTSVIISNSVTSISDYTFQNCSALTSITIPNGVTSIGNSAFSGCRGLISLTIPNSVNKIGEYAFSGCKGLTSVTIPNSVTSICAYAFAYDSGLTSVNIYCNPEIVPGYFSGSKDVFCECNNIKDAVFDSEIVIPILQNKISLKRIILKGNVTSIEKNAFSGCTGLVSLTIGSGVTSIENGAFSGTSLKKVFWLTNTPPSGYSYAQGTVNYVANEQFGSMNNKIVYPFLSSMFEVDGINYVPISPSERTCDLLDCISDSVPSIMSISTTVSYKGISMFVKNVQPYAYYEKNNIHRLICNNNGKIAKYAFSGCSNIESVTLGDSISSIEEYAFSGCSSIKGMNIPKFVKKIGDNAFSGCSSLNTFVIADRDEELTLGSNGKNPLFASCPLDSIYIGGNISYKTSSNYGYSPFYRNTTLRTVVITDKETEISPNMFYGCTSLQNFTVGDGVTSFGDWAFSGCSALKSLSFGSQLKTIGKEAFSDCGSVIQIVSKSPAPPTCGTQALDDINKWTCTLYVPKGSLSSYQRADQWKEFFFMKEGDGNTQPDNPQDFKCATPTISYSNGELSFASATDDVEFFSTITDADITSYNTKTITLGVTYNVSVYAAKTGYENSEAATAMLCWIDVDPKTEGIENSVANVKAIPVLIQGEDGVLRITGAPEGVAICVYDTGGKMIGSVKVSSDTTLVPTTLPNGSIAIVKIGEKSVKVLVK